MGVHGTTSAVLYTIGWSILYGIVLSLLIAVIAYAAIISIGLTGSSTQSMTSMVIVFGLLYFGSVCYFTYKIISNTYQYGWRDAEEHHTISDDKRKCKNNEWCKEMP